MGSAGAREQARCGGVKGTSPTIAAQWSPLSRGEGTLETCPSPLEKVVRAPRETEEVTLLASISVTGTLNATRTTWSLPEEVPVALQLNSAPYAVMMATPQDLQDFAIGFALSEGLIETAGNITNVLVMPAGEGFTVDLAIAENNIIRERMISRSIEGRVGCGLCGVTEMEDAVRMPPGKLPPSHLDVAAVSKAFNALPDHQPMNAINKTVHAAAWCSVDGSIRLAREDVGRHNALDKLIGSMAQAGTSPRGGFVLMSSRCSFELVQKCAIVGISALATVSAPTALAHKLAQQCGMNLAALSKQGIMIFDGEI
jgi:FdhD protein